MATLSTNSGAPVGAASEALWEDAPVDGVATPTLATATAATTTSGFLSAVNMNGAFLPGVLG